MAHQRNGYVALATCMNGGFLQKYGELIFIGGFGTLLVFGPDLYDYTMLKLQPYLAFLGQRFRESNAYMYFSCLNRKRKNGSIIRVIASLLPRKIFPPSGRIFVASVDPTWNTPFSMGIGYIPDSTNIINEKVCSNGDIVGFAQSDIDDDYGADSDIKTIDDGDGDCSSNPEGWDIRFNPPDFLKCSTPKRERQNILDEGDQICEHQLYRSASGLSVRSDGLNSCSDEAQANLADLKLMVQTLMTQFNQFVSSKEVMKSAPSYLQISDHTSEKNHSSKNSMLTNIAPLPPPPPPPLPLAVPTGNVPFIKIKSKKCDEITSKKHLESRPVTLTDVLKELPKAKLRKIDRSPGGTPRKLEQKYENDDLNPLTIALKKRFACIHSPTPEESSEDEETIKENSKYSLKDDSMNYKTTSKSYKEPISPRKSMPRRDSLQSVTLKENLNVLNENVPPVARHS